MSHNDYASLKQFILDGRSKTSRKIENNTTVRFVDDHIIIRLHDTDIVEFYPDNTIVLNSGGYKTQTTKSRINEFLPIYFRLSQEKGLWILSYIKDWNWQNKIDYPFADFMMINPDNTVSGTGTDTKKLLKLKNDIKKYAKEFINKLASGKVEKPNGGDCWYCAMREVETHKPLGEQTNNIDHLLSHMKEKYYVGNLFYRAIELYPMSLFSNSALYELWYEDKKSLDDWQKGIFTEQAYKSLLKYLYSQFNLPN